jgi:hypothetical protein
MRHEAVHLPAAKGRLRWLGRRRNRRVALQHSRTVSTRSAVVTFPQRQCPLVGANDPRHDL